MADTQPAADQSPAKGHRGLKDKIAHPFPELREKLKDTHLYDAKIKATHAKNKLGKFKNIFNPNHRHDEEHEQKTDEKRSRVCANHRFNSFAPEREKNMVKWYIDGRDYFWVRASVHRKLSCN
jgi:phospholipase D1/2